MKLRIRAILYGCGLPNRSRARIAEGLRLEEQLCSGEPHQRLSYALECSTDGENMKADYRDGRITVRLPQTVAREWAMTDRVSRWRANARRQQRRRAVLRLLIENFACLTDRRGAETRTPSRIR
jgi:hypothetical protein